MKIQIFESDEVTASDLTQDRNVLIFLKICGISYVIVIFLNMSKLAFSEYYLISSAGFKLPPDSKSNC